MSDPDNFGSDRAAADILVLGGIVVTMDERRTILPDGGLALRGDSITALGPRTRSPRHTGRHHHRRDTACDPRSDRRPHAHPDDALPRPGGRSAAAHLARAARVAGGASVHQARDRPLGEPPRCRGAAAFGRDYACDMYFYEDEVAAVVDELGLCGVLSKAHFDFTTATNTDLEQNLAEAEQFVARWRGHPRIVPALGPHAPYTVGPDLYRSVHALAERHDTLVSRTWPRPRKRIATSAAATAARRPATWRTSVSWTAAGRRPLCLGRRRGDRPACSGPNGRGAQPAQQPEARQRRRAGSRHAARRRPGRSRNRWRREQQRARPVLGDPDGGAHHTRASGSIPWPSPRRRRSRWPPSAARER